MLPDFHEEPKQMQALEIENKNSKVNANREGSSPLVLGLSALGIAILSFIIGFLCGPGKPGGTSLAPKSAGPLPALASSKTIVIGLESEQKYFNMELLELVCNAAKVNCAAVLVPRASIIPDAFSDWIPEGAKNTARLPGVGFYEGWFNCKIGEPFDLRSKMLVRYTTLYEAADGEIGEKGFMCHPARADIVADLDKGLHAIKSGKLRELCKKHDVRCVQGLTEPSTKLNAAKHYLTFPFSSIKAEIIIGVDVHWAPWSEIDTQGEIKGFDMDFLPMVCMEAGVTCTLVGVPFQSTIPGHWTSLGVASPNTAHYPGEGYQNGWFHCSAGQRKSIERLETFSFTDPYTDPDSDLNIGVFAGRAGSHKGDDSDIRGKTVAVQSGTTQEIVALKKLVSKYDLVMKPMHTGREMFKALKDEIVDAVFFTKGELVGDLEPYFSSGEIVIMGPKGEKVSEGMGLMCHPSRFDIVEKLNDGLRKIKKKSAWKDLCAKYGKKVACDTLSHGDKAAGPRWQFKY